jgi:hypothetical protein
MTTCLVGKSPEGARQSRRSAYFDARSRCCRHDAHGKASPDGPNRIPEGVVASRNEDREQIAGRSRSWGTPSEQDESRLLLEGLAAQLKSGGSSVEVGEAVGGLAQWLSEMSWVGEDRHDQRLDQGEPMLSLWLVSVAGSREGTVQLAQEQDDGLFVHHGGLSVHGHHRTLGLASAAMLCSLATLLVTGHFRRETWGAGWP